MKKRKNTLFCVSKNDQKCSGRKERNDYWFDSFPSLQTPYFEMKTPKNTLFCVSNNDQKRSDGKESELVFSGSFYFSSHRFYKETI